MYSGNDCEEEPLHSRCESIFFFVCETSSSSIFSDSDFSPEKLKERCVEKSNSTDPSQLPEKSQLFTSACEVELESNCHVYQQLIDV